MAVIDVPPSILYLIDEIKLLEALSSTTKDPILIEGYEAGIEALQRVLDLVRKL